MCVQNRVKASNARYSLELRHGLINRKSAGHQSNMAWWGYRAMKYTISLCGRRRRSPEANPSDLKPLQTTNTQIVEHAALTTSIHPHAYARGRISIVGGKSAVRVGGLVDRPFAVQATQRLSVPGGLIGLLAGGSRCPTRVRRGRFPRCTP